MNYIDKNHRLPGMPSEKEVTKNGLDVGEILRVQTQKIEELTFPVELEVYGYAMIFTLLSCV
jgi:hypothetical protein